MKGEMIRSFEEIKLIADKYDSVKDFRKNDNTIFIYARTWGLLDKLFPNRIKRRKLSDEEIILEAKKYKFRSELDRIDQAIYQRLRKLNLLDEIFPIKKRKWTMELVIAEAKKYKSRGEFYNNSVTAYERLIKFPNIMNELFPNRVSKYKTNKNRVSKWTLENLKVEAIKYKTRSEFYKNNASAYNYALKFQGFMDEMYQERKYYNRYKKIIYTKK